MANITVSTSRTIASAEANLGDEQNFTIINGAVLTIDQSPTKLIGQTKINDGVMLFDGANAVNPIIYCGEDLEEINVNGVGRLETTLGWWEFPTLGTGLANQTFDCSTYFVSSPITADVFSGVWIETGRRIDYDGGSGIPPAVYDWCFRTDGTILGRIVEVSGDGVTGFIVLEWSFESLLDNDTIELHTNQDNGGSDYQKSWNAVVNNASGDVFHANVFSRWGNLTQNNTSGLLNVFNGFEGMGFDQAFQSNILTFGDGINGLIVPNGARIRVPMVHFCSSTVAKFALGDTNMNASELNRHNIETILGGEVALNGVSLGSAYFADAEASAFSASYVAFNIGLGMQNCGSKVTMDNIIGVGDLAGLNRTTVRYPLYTVDLINGCQIDDVTMLWMHNGGAESSIVGGTTSFDLNYNRVIQVCESVDLRFNKVKGGTLHDVVIVGKEMKLVTATNIDINLLKVQARFDGANTSTLPNITCNTFSDGITIKGIEILKGAGIDNANIVVQDAFNIKVRGFHFIDDPHIKSIPEEEFINCSGLASNVDVARCFTSGQSNPDEFIIAVSTCKDVTVTDCSGDYSGEIQPRGTNVVFNGVAGGSGNIGIGLETDYVASFGGNVASFYRSDLIGAIGVLFMPNSGTRPFTEIVGNPKFTKDGDVDMVSGDSFVIHSYMKMSGHSSFTGVFTTSKDIGSVADGTDEIGTSVTIEFQYDVGLGFNGVWLDLRVPSNLTSITGMVSGIAMKFRFTATGTKTGINGMIVHTNSTIADRKANFTPIDQFEATLTLSGLQVGSDVVILQGGTQTVLASIDQGGTQFNYTYSTLQDIDIGVIKQGFVTLYQYGYTLGAGDATLPINQLVDRNYL